MAAPSMVVTGQALMPKGIRDKYVFMWRCPICAPLRVKCARGVIGIGNCTSSRARQSSISNHRAKFHDGKNDVDIERWMEPKAVAHVS